MLVSGKQNQLAVHFVAGVGTCDDVEWLCGFHIITPDPGQFTGRHKMGDRVLRCYIKRSTLN